METFKDEIENLEFVRDNIVVNNADAVNRLSSVIRVLQIHQKEAEVKKAPKQVSHKAKEVPVEEPSVEKKGSLPDVQEPSLS